MGVKGETGWQPASPLAGAHRCAGAIRPRIGARRSVSPEVLKGPKGP